MRRIARFFAASLAAAAVLAAVLLLSPQPLRALDSAQLVEKRCTACHGIDQVYSQKRTAAGWREVVTRMAGYEGSELSRVDQLIIIKYLETNYGID
ncbi:MAG: photosystem P840 reaction-center cytochrome c-551 [Deltaproteobacteria bacterium]|nr:photosystem P840 reaction-center cytochrome c-551 [Candidatus Anaeroferrophillacea bacterium]